MTDASLLAFAGVTPSKVVPSPDMTQYQWTTYLKEAAPKRHRKKREAATNLLAVSGQQLTGSILREFRAKLEEQISQTSRAAEKLKQDVMARALLLQSDRFRQRLRQQDDQTEKLFLALVIAWKHGRGPTSSIRELAMHPAYQRIIGMGERVVPFILRELEREPDHWFWALTAITGQDPIPKEARGRVERMAKIWLNWGRENGYSWTP